jgi:preprotein translocase subunit SecD
VNRRRLLVTLVLTLVVAWGGLAGVLAAGWTPKLGLDLQGGFSVQLTAPGVTDGAVLEQAVEIMRRRIENLGQVQEPEISVQGNRSILVQLPGVQDRERALQAVGTTGELSFRPVLARQQGISPAFLDGTLPLPEELQPEDPEGEDGETPEIGESPSTTTATEEGTDTTSPGSTVAPTTTVAPSTTVPPTTTTTAPTTTTIPPPPPENIDPDTGLTIVDDPTTEAYLAEYVEVDGERVPAVFYHVGPAFLVGADLTDAEPLFSGGTGGGGAGGWVVDPSFTSEGGEKFRVATGELAQFAPADPRRALAIVVDGEVSSAPVVAEEVGPEGLDPTSVIITIGSGQDQEAEARDLATILRYGALPTTFEREREESVSASLGSDSLQAGLAAGIGGLVLVALAMVIYYRALGIVAIVGLSVFGSLLITSIILLGEFQGTTLTLAGVTGIIVSVGITADSYIVFYERIKEEHRRGRPLRPSVDSGFGRAFRTILTADTVTFAGSILLWALAIGPVKGFAIALGIATVIDVLVAYFYTRPTVMLLVRTRAGEGGPLSIRGAMGRSRDELPSAVVT